MSILKEQIVKQLRNIKRNAIIITSGTGDSLHIRKTWLLGGTISAIWGEQRNYVNNENTYSDEMGQQNAFKIISHNKKLLVITIYQMPEGSSTGIYVQEA